MSNMSDTSHEQLFEPYDLGNTKLPNRAVLAPLTRVSAEPDGSASDRIAEYYRIFAAGGFATVITEGMYIDTERSPGYFNQAGMATDAHVESWRKVADAVHGEGSTVLAQIMHAGPQMQGNHYGLDPVGPTGTPVHGDKLSIYGGSGPYPVPTAMTQEDIRQVRDAFVDSAKRAREAGFDGVEIHGANGYLLDAFLTDYLNDRADEYGGSPRNRVRLMAEVTAAVRQAMDKDFLVGLRVSQSKVSDFTHKWAGGVDEAEVIFTELAKTGVDYIHTTEYIASAPAFDDDARSLAALARQFTDTTVIANGHIDTAADAISLLDQDQADLVAIGKAALANRNWPERARTGASLAEPFVPLEGGLADVEYWETDAEALLALDATAD